MRHLKKDLAMVAFVGLVVGFGVHCATLKAAAKESYRWCAPILAEAGVDAAKCAASGKVGWDCALEAGAEYGIQWLNCVYQEHQKGNHQEGDPFDSPPSSLLYLPSQDAPRFAESRDTAVPTSEYTSLTTIAACPRDGQHPVSFARCMLRTRPTNWSTSMSGVNGLSPGSITLLSPKLRRASPSGTQSVISYASRINDIH